MENENKNLNQETEKLRAFVWVLPVYGRPQLL